MNASSFNKVSFIKSISNLEQRPDQDLPEIAFIGRSNVGKSSLLNAICGRKSMAKVSATPGKTKLINYFLVNQSYHFVDLPGYGYAKIPKRILEKIIHSPAKIEGVEINTAATPRSTSDAWQKGQKQNP